MSVPPHPVLAARYLEASTEDPQRSAQSNRHAGNWSGAEQLSRSPNRGITGEAGKSFTGKRHSGFIENSTSSNDDHCNGRLDVVEGAADPSANGLNVPQRFHQYDDSDSVAGVARSQDLANEESGENVNCWNGRLSHRTRPARRRRSMEDATPSVNQDSLVPGTVSSLARSDSWPPRRIPPSELVPSVVEIPETWAGDSWLRKWAAAGSVENAMHPAGLMAARADLVEEHTSGRWR